VPANDGLSRLVTSPSLSYRNFGGSTLRDKDLRHSPLPLRIRFFLGRFLSFLPAASLRLVDSVLNGSGSAGRRSPQRGGGVQPPSTQTGANYSSSTKLRWGTAGPAEKCSIPSSSLSNFERLGFPGKGVEG